MTIFLAIKIRKITLSYVVLLGCSLANASVVNLRCEYLRNPLGIDVPKPRLSWELESDLRGEMQISAQIIVASSKANIDANIGDLWSTTISNSKSFQVEYNGSTLHSEMSCFWKVKVNGTQGSYDVSEPAMWSMGLLAQSDWSSATWIGDDAPDISTPAPMLRNSFTLSKPVRRAMVYVTSQGAYELHLNGNRVGDQILAPGWTDYRKRVLYQAYDITALLNAGGENVVGAIIGDGWYNAKMQGWPGRGANGSSARKLLLKLVVENTDGSKTTIVSDESWKLWRDGPVRHSDIYNGETIDSRKSFLASGQLTLEALDNNDLTISFTNNWTNINSNLGSKWFNGTARSCNKANDYCQYTNSNCTQISYYATKGDNQGQADFYIDSTFKQKVDLYAPARTASTLLFNSGTLPQGSHTLKVVVKHQKNAASGDYWVECDKIEVMTQLSSIDIGNWDKPGFSADNWVAPKLFTVTGSTVNAQMCEPIRVTQEITPIAMTKPQTGVYIFDMGQNMVGWCRVTLSGPAGTQVTLRHGEMLNPDGTLYTTNLRTASQTDVFILNGTNNQVFEPHFTYHGFRYVELTGMAGTPTTATITGRVFHSDMPMSGTFTSSSMLLNKIWLNTLWGQRGNHMSVPTDCPQRDERMGWMGDAQIFSQTAIFNMGMGAFYTKWIQDMHDNQTTEGAFQDVSPNINLGMGAPAWGDAGVVIPWRLYQNYGDLRLVQQHYASVKKWIDMIRSGNSNNLWQNNRGADYSDWLDGSAISGVSGYPLGNAIPKEVFATAFYYQSTTILTKMAALLGNTADATTYTTLANNIKAAFNATFVNATTGVINGNSQSGYALALNFGLLDESVQPKAAKNMNDVIVNTYNTRISTGFNTTLRLMMELSNRGYNATAYALAESKRMPSWGYSIDQGATTIWERWDGYVAGRGFQDPGMNSFNHYSFGSVCEWFYRVILGINPDEAYPGYTHFFIKPQPGGTLTSAQGSYNSISGTIKSSWKMDKNNVYSLNVTVPGNTTAEIIIPKSKSITDWIIREGGTLCWSSNAYVNGAAGISGAAADSNFVTFSVGAGSYSFMAGSSGLVGVRPRVESAVNISRLFYNPLNHTVVMHYNVSNAVGNAELVTLRLYDLRGAMVAEIINGRQKPGTYNVVWQSQNRNDAPLANGAFVLRMQIGNKNCLAKKMAMLRK